MDWKPGEDFTIIIDDKSAECRTDEQFDEMIEKIRKVVNEYDFDISSCGSWRCVSKQVRWEVVNDIRKILDKLDILKKD